MMATPGFRTFVLRALCRSLVPTAFVGQFHVRSRRHLSVTVKFFSSSTKPASDQGTKATSMVRDNPLLGYLQLSPHAASPSHGTRWRSNDRVIMINLLPLGDYSAASFHRLCRLGN